MKRRTFLAASGALAAAATLPISALAQAGAAAMTAEWTGPYGGVPAFDKVRTADFVPALNAAMKADTAEIDAICSLARRSSWRRCSNSASGRVPLGMMAELP